jgi:hypothetical protein
MHFALASASALLLASTAVAMPAQLSTRATVQARDSGYNAPIYMQAKPSSNVSFTPRFARFNGDRETDNGHQILEMGASNGHTLAGEAFKVIAAAMSLLISLKSCLY